MSTFRCASAPESAGYAVTRFSLGIHETRLTRHVDPHPFVPGDPARRAERCEDVFSIQAFGLAKRLVHTHSLRRGRRLGRTRLTLALLAPYEPSTSRTLTVRASSR